MATHFLQAIFTGAGLQSVFTTLMHSLWLGAAMAFLAGIVVMLTKRSEPQIRYKLLAGLMILFAACMGYVFYNAVTGTAATDETAYNILQAPANTGAHTTENGQQQTVADILLSFANKNAGIFVLIWFAVICLKCIQLVSGLRQLHRLKHTNIFEAGTYWNGRLHSLAAKTGITKKVLLLQSSLVKVPMVIGHLKPVILFPVALLNSLPQNEAEAILLHELAHIKRNDFLINLLQQFAEIIFFFNPAVLWVSALIKNERENCCDDIAIALTQDKKIFIHALVAFQEYNAGPGYATTFAGAKNHLLNRVKRIITNNNKTLNNMEKIILASGIIITCMAAVAFSPKKVKDNKDTTGNVAQKATSNTTYKSAGNAAAKFVNTSDTTPHKETKSDSSHSISYKGDIDGKKIELNEKNGRVTELYVDGKKITEAEYGQYKPLIDKVHQQMKEGALQLKLSAAQLELQKQEMQKQAEQMQQEAENMKVQSKIMQEEFLKQQEAFKLQQIEFRKKTEEFKIKQEKYKQMIKNPGKVKTVTAIEPVVSISATAAVKPATAVQSKMSVKTTASGSKTATTTSTVSSIDAQPGVSVTSSVIASPEVQATATSATEEIIRDLKEENIISTGRNLSFRLTKDELIVNGVKQPSAIHQKILKNHVPKPGDTFSMSYSHQE